MLRTSTLALCAIGMLVFISAAHAENSPNLRDCSLVSPPPPAVDPDFVMVTGATMKVDKSGNLTVTTAQNVVDLTASESVDSGDHAGAVTLKATVASPGQPTLNFSSGPTPGFVVIGVPLNGTGVGKVYTISWSATFDNGQHACPSSITTENTAPNPFVIHVVGQ